MSDPDSQPRVAVDTNVLFSALSLGPESPPARLLDLARDGRVALYASPCIMQELETVLLLRAGWDADRVLAALKKLKRLLAVVEPRTRLDLSRKNPSSDRVLECALEARAEVLVTGDMDDLRPLGILKETVILTPREFIDLYFPRLGAASGMVL